MMRFSFFYQKKKVLNRFYKTLRGRLIVSFSVTSIVLIILLVTFFYFVMKNSLIKNAEKMIKYNTEAVALKVEKTNMEAVTVPKTMAIAQENGMWGNRKLSTAYAREILKNTPRFTGAYFGYEPNADQDDQIYRNNNPSQAKSMDKNGRYLPYWFAAGEQIKLTPLINMETSLYYQGCKDRYFSTKKDKAMVTEPYFYEGKMIVEQTYPIEINGKFMGIAGVDRALTDLLIFLNSFKPYDTSKLILISRMGRIISSNMNLGSEKTFKLSLEKLKSKGQKIEETQLDRSMLTFDINDTDYSGILQMFHKARKGTIPLLKKVDPFDNNTYYYYSGKIPTGDWTIVMRVAENEILRPIKIILYGVSGASLLLIGLQVILAIHLSRTMTDPINEVIDASTRIANGNFEVFLQRSDISEIDTLALSLANTAHKLKILTQKLNDEKDQLEDEVEERKQIEASLSESHERFKKVVDGLDAIVYVSDMDNHELLFVNKYAEDVFGDILGTTCWKTLQTNQTGVCSFCTNEKLLDKNGNSTGIYKWEYPNSSNGSWYDCRDQAIPWTDGRMVRMEIAMDITDRKKTEEELSKHRDHLEELVKERTIDLTHTNKKLEKEKEKAEAANRAKSAFLTNMSHEIRTPMNAILGFTEILKEKIENPQLSLYIKSVFSAGKSLLSLINDILDLSKVEAGMLTLEYKPVSLLDILDEMKTVFEQKTSDKGLEFIMEIPFDLPIALFLDEIRIRQVLINLIGNAIKFTNTGYVKVSAKYQYPDPIHRSLIDLTILVEDTGMGIAEDQLDVVFNAFVQQKGQKTSQFGGTGLGLAITKNLIKVMKGEIHIKSEVGKGSVFFIELKGIEVSSAEALKSTQEKFIDFTSLQFKGSKILIVDDIKYNRDLVSSYLEDFNLMLLEAENGKEAIYSAKKNHPNLVLMDMKMPEMDGYEAMNILKKDKALKTIPVIAVTASAMKKDEEMISQLFDSYLRKPISKTDLVAEIMKFLPHFMMKKHKSVNVGTTAAKEPLKTGLKTAPDYFELQKILKRRCKESEHLCCNMAIDKIETFARDMKKLGNEFQCESLVLWGEDLYLAAVSFDADKIKQILEELYTI